MIWPLQNLLRARVLRRSDTSAAYWLPAWRRLPLLRGLDDDEAARLRRLATLFLHEKTLEPVDGLTLTTHMGQTVALQACLPVLNLGIDWLDGWVSVIVYPDAFASTFSEEDHAGVVHDYREERSGEAWERGPLVLSWADVEEGAALDGNNVILHEIAHKLDALDGGTNGKPPLHRGMSVARWSEVFSAAFADLERRVDTDEDCAIDPYAVTSPAEFFAVLTEAFFETPYAVESTYPEVYGQLTELYRQDPLARLSPGRGRGRRYG
jgi:Mlc titration factor MtfA (ptsG expression regulator)